MEMEWDEEGFFPPEPEIPSREQHKRWIHAFSPSVENIVVDYMKVGKWLLFFDQVHISEVTGLTQQDYAWQFIKKLVESDILYHAKCSTPSKGICEAYDKSSKGVMCCYTPDYTDKQNVKRAADAIRQVVECPFNIFYKTDNDTRAGKYQHTGYGFVSIYKHTATGDMYERDSEIKYQWNLVNV